MSSEEEKVPENAENAAYAYYSELLENGVDPLEGLNEEALLAVANMNEA